MTDTDLYQQLAATLGLEKSELVRQMYKVLVDEREAQILLAASPPATIEELAANTGFKEDEIEKAINSLFIKGLMFKSKKPDATRYYRVRQFLQFHDATAIAKDAPQELLDLLKEFMHTEWDDFQSFFKELLPKPIFRVIPVNVSINPATQILAFDDVKEQIESAQTLAVTACSCRVIDGSCEKPIDVCLQLNKSARYAIERGTGRAITKNEAIDILKVCEDAGLLHVTKNARSLGHVICNCCEDCCMSWVAGKEKITKAVAPSRFTAFADPDLCTSCETCIQRCFFGAISLKGENSTALVDADKCMGCGLCLVTCPDKALSLKETRAEDFVPV